MSERLGGCAQACADFFLVATCCGSCHEDADEYDYSLREIGVDGGWYDVCCAVGVAYDKRTASEVKP